MVDTRRFCQVGMSVVRRMVVPSTDERSTPCAGNAITRGATRQDYLDELRGLVMKNGWAVQYVEADPPFAYTVGLSGAGLPELLITGLPPARSMLLLNEMAHYMVHEVEPAPGDTMTFPDGSGAEFVEVTHPDVHMGWAVAFRSGPIRGLQIAWRDERGHSPWCPDFNSGGRRQPVLGTRGPVDT